MELDPKTSTKEECTSSKDNQLSTSQIPKFIQEVSNNKTDTRICVARASRYKIERNIYLDYKYVFNTNYLSPWGFGVLGFSGKMDKYDYYKVGNRSTSFLVVNPRSFRLLMKGKFDGYLL